MKALNGAFTDVFVFASLILDPAWLFNVYVVAAFHGAGLECPHTRIKMELFIIEESLKLYDTVPLKCSVLEAYIRKFFQYRGVNNLEVCPLRIRI